MPYVLKVTPLADPRLKAWLSDLKKAGIDPDTLIEKLDRIPQALNQGGLPPGATPAPPVKGRQAYGLSIYGRRIIFAVNDNLQIIYLENIEDADTP